MFVKGEGEVVASEHGRVDEVSYLGNVGLYNTQTGLFHGPRILWADDDGENKDTGDEETTTTDDKAADTQTKTTAKTTKTVETTTDTDDDDDDDDSDEETIDAKDSELAKHLKKKINKANNQNKNLRIAKRDLSAKLSAAEAARKAAETKLADVEGSLQRLNAETANTRIEKQLMDIGVAPDQAPKARKLLEDKHYVEVEKEVNGKKTKVKEIDAEKFKSDNPFFFGPNTRRAPTTTQTKKGWVPQGGAKTDTKEAAPTTGIMKQFKGPSSHRKGSE